jgi:hypothetical protein
VTERAVKFFVPSSPRFKRSEDDAAAADRWNGDIMM